MWCHHNQYCDMSAVLSCRVQTWNHEGSAVLRQVQVTGPGYRSRFCFREPGSVQMCLTPGESSASRPSLVTSPADHFHAAARFKVFIHKSLMNLLNKMLVNKSDTNWFSSKHYLTNSHEKKTNIRCFFCLIFLSKYSQNEQNRDEETRKKNSVQRIGSTQLLYPSARSGICTRAHVQVIRLNHRTIKVFPHHEINVCFLSTESRICHFVWSGSKTLIHHKSSSSLKLSEQRSSWR